MASNQETPIFPRPLSCFIWKERTGLSFNIVRPILFERYAFVIPSLKWLSLLLLLLFM